MQHSRLKERITDFNFLYLIIGFVVISLIIVYIDNTITEETITEEPPTLNIVTGVETQLYEGQKGTFGNYDISLRYVYPDHINIVTYSGGTDRALTSSGGKIGEIVTLSSVKIKYMVNYIKYDRNSANRYAIITFNHLP